MRGLEPIQLDGLHPIEIGSASHFIEAAIVDSPDDIAGLALWLKSDAGLFQDAGTTPATASNDPMGRWADQSGNGRHFNQTTSGFKPLLQLNVVNSRPVIRFDGTDDLLNGPTFAALTEGEVFIVVKIDTDPPGLSAQCGLWDFGSAGLAGVFPFTDGVIYEAWGTDTRKTTVDPTPALTSFRLYNVRSASGAFSTHLDGTQLFTTAINTPGFTTTTRIGRGSAVDNFLDGDIAEVIIYNAVLAAGNRTSIHTYIANRYGLTIA
jgi:hypothetical protein